MQTLVAGIGTHNLHGLYQVEVYQTRLAIVEQSAHELERVGSGTVGLGHTPCHSHHLGLLANDATVAWGGDGLLWRVLRTAEVGIGLPVAEVLVDGGDDLVGVHVARHADSHIIGSVVAAEVVLDVDYRGVLQVLLCADGGLRAVGMGGVEQFVECSPHLAVVLRESYVELLVDSLELGVEAAYHHVLEAVALDFGPVDHLVGGNVLDIAGHIVAGVGVGALGSDRRHELVVLVGDVVAGCQLRYRVYLVIGLASLLGVGHLAVALVALLYLVEVGLLLGVVGGAKLLGSLKHKVLQIVSQTGGLGWVVARTGAHGDVGLDAWFLLVYTQIHFQTIVKRVDATLHGVALHGLVLVVLGDGLQRRGQQDQP